jgi:hypothetical protein
MCKVRLHDVREFAFIYFGVSQQILEIFESFEPAESSEEEGTDIKVHAAFLFDDCEANEIGHTGFPAGMFSGVGYG